MRHIRHVNAETKTVVRIGTFEFELVLSHYIVTKIVC